MRYFLLVFALVFGCQEVAVKQAPQIPELASIKASADVVALPPAPVVTVKGIWPEYHDNTITLAVEAENGATHYQFASMGGVHDCEENFEEKHYSGDKEVAGDRTFTLNISYNGYYTLCLRGRNSDAIQDNVSQYRFKKVDPPPPESVGMLEITTSHQPTSIHLFSTYKGEVKITLSNKGTSDLVWKIAAEAAASWLKLGTGSNDLRVVHAADLVGGTLVTGGNVSVWLRLADIHKTDYAAGIKTAKLKVYNVSGEDDPVSISVHLYIPRVELIPDPKLLATISLDSVNKTEKIMLHNSATRSGWPVMSQLIPLQVDAEFTQVVNVRRDRDASQTSFIEASINEAALLAKEDGYKRHMYYLLITNTSSEEQERNISTTCGDIFPEGVVGGMSRTIGAVVFTPQYTTNICRYVYVVVER